MGRAGQHGNEVVVRTGIGLLGVPHDEVIVSGNAFLPPGHHLLAFRLHIDPYRRQLALDRRSQGLIQRVPGVIGVLQRQCLPILFPNTGGLIQHPSGLIQKCVGFFRIVGTDHIQLHIRIGDAVGEQVVGGSFLAIGQPFGKGFLVDGVGYGFAHFQIGQNAGGVEHQVAGLGVALRHRAGDIGEGGGLLIVIPSQKCAAVDQVDLTALERLKPGGGVGNVLDNDFIIVGLFSPVVLVADKADIITVHDLLIHIGAGAYHAIHGLVVPLLQYSGRYQNHNLRIAEVHQIGKVGIGIVECHRVLVHDLNFLGVVAISDPIRPDVPAAVAKCQSAGIGIKIVTGDTPGTATEIARQIGLWNSETDTERNRITGVAFAELSDEEALDRVMDLKIMSRARPTDKQRLVQLLQQKGAVVAVTGDGTNDAPALNHAQVGLSMGTGTSVAKEASDITLLDDSFNSIGTAVMWGRSLYKNIQRFIVFQLTINFVALLIVLLGSVIGTELPLTVTQMLWVNLIMDTFAALALASIPPSETVMLEKPRRSTDFIISKAMRSNIIGVGSIFLIVLLGMIYYFDHSTQGMNVHNLTIFFTFFVMLQFWNLFNARVFGTTNSAFKGLSKSYGMELIVLAILAGQFLIVQFGGAVFRTEPLDWQTWLLIIGVSSTVLWVGELVRLVQRIIHKKDRNEK